MGAVGLLLRAQLRQHGKSWLALAGLVALVGGLVMAAAATARKIPAGCSYLLAQHQEVWEVCIRYGKRYEALP